jgi:hypothetical protein
MDPENVGIQSAEEMTGKLSIGPVGVPILTFLLRRKQIGGDGRRACGRAPCVTDVAPNGGLTGVKMRIYRVCVLL